MTSNRKEPSFSSTSLDDHAPGRTVSTPAAGAETLDAPKRRPPPVPAAPAKSSPLLPLALLLALTGLGLAGYAYWQLLIAQQQVSVAEKRLTILENRLALSDDESTQSVAALQANLKETGKSLELAHTEIRKLWDTRNVNKKAIADNDAQIASLTKSVKSAASAASAAQKLAGDQVKNWKALSAEVALQVEQVRVATDLAEGQQQRIRELVDSTSKLESQFGQLKTDLASRVKTNEEAIQSIDNYRRIVNRDLLQIKQQLSPSGP